MKNWMKPVTRAALVLTASVAMVACGNMSKNVASDGQTADELRWPSAESAINLHKGGKHPTLDRLVAIHTDMNKQQIMDLIGPPNFGEGWGVREWTYLFSLPAADWVPADIVDQYGELQCMFKVLFDKDKLAKSFHWKPEGCADIVGGKQPEPEVTQYTLGADALFAFDKADLRSSDIAELDQLVSDVSAHMEDILSIQVTGYTDKLGSDSYNQQLSEARADAVRNYLVQRGVPASMITSRGLGKANPVVTGCESAGSNAAVISCLQPNRRVEIEVNAVN